MKKYLSAITFCLSFAVLSVNNAFAIEEIVTELKLETIAEADVDKIPNASIEATAFSFNSVVGMSKIENDVLLYRARYEYRVISESDDLFDEKKLHTLGFGFDFIKTGETWLHQFYLEPGIYSDLDDVDEHDLGVVGRYLAIYRPPANWDYFLGIGVDRQFGEPVIYPLIGGVYSPNKQLLVRITLPAVWAEYRIRPRWNLYGELKPMGNQWNIEPEIPGAQPEGSVDFVASGIRLASGIEYGLSKAWWIGGEVGMLVDQTYKFEDQGDGDFEMDLDDSFTAAITLRYRK